jgi:hypothetical protein
MTTPATTTTNGSEKNIKHSETYGVLAGPTNIAYILYKRDHSFKINEMG